MKSISIGYPEFLLTAGIVLVLLSTGPTGMALICLSIGSAIVRTSMDVNTLSKEQERKTREEERMVRAEERVDKAIAELVKHQKHQELGNLALITSPRYTGGDDNGPNGGQTH